MIEWTNCRVKLGDLKPWSDNPRFSTKAQAQRIIDSLKKYGQPLTIAIDPDNNVLDGHQRLSAWLTVHGADFEVDARRSNRPLTDEERRGMAIALSPLGAFGSFDWDKLSGWDSAELKAWGADSETLKGWKTDVSALSAFVDSEGDDQNYSRKIEAPIYTPKGPKPEIKDLFDDKRAKELLDEIEASELPEEEKEFLRIAARRHTVLNFKRIAEYYAHSPAPVQRLMENSALVIIDFKRAIELGYVKLSEEIAAQYLKDYPNA